MTILPIGWAEDGPEVEQQRVLGHLHTNLTSGCWPELLRLEVHVERPAHPSIELAEECESRGIAYSLREVDSSWRQCKGT